ncbi:uncharacterized protein MONBRDRAFT_32274 [Monosiga brevicollis MX1]|uniref:Fibronectin type-III domain-containing protein n=1 Tax=Monosiga brevicollis TaxID=81824 RepID=A9UYH1_MONBE|nr:uncharacterized protein MONBRDRAFT_32274 [Monosiga brevicollis MX1]EDQ89605.1 predicted protein [Monosiga brevicollis MX1]|eukprot:XP_001745634.1 hypothetical protein [Monosiga brevicollis MX1]
MAVWVCLWMGLVAVAAAESCRMVLGGSGDRPDCHVTLTDREAFDVLCECFADVSPSDEQPPFQMVVTGAPTTGHTTFMLWYLESTNVTVNYNVTGLLPVSGSMNGKVGDMAYMGDDALAFRGQVAYTPPAAPVNYSVALRVTGGTDRMTTPDGTPVVDLLDPSCLHDDGENTCFVSINPDYAVQMGSLFTWRLRVALASNMNATVADQVMPPGSLSTNIALPKNCEPLAVTVALQLLWSTGGLMYEGPPSNASYLNMSTLPSAIEVLTVQGQLLESSDRLTITWKDVDTGGCGPVHYNVSLQNANTSHVLDQQTVAASIETATFALTAPVDVGQVFTACITPYTALGPASTHCINSAPAISAPPGHGHLILALSIGLPIGVVLVAATVYLMWRKRRRALYQSL